MQDIIRTKAEELSEALMNSRIYSRYNELLEIIKQDEGLYSRVNEYRRGNMQLLSMSPEEWLYEGEKLIAQYKDVFDNDTAREFLATEDELCNQLGMIKDYIYKAIHLDLEFLD